MSKVNKTKGKPQPVDDDLSDASSSSAPVTKKTTNGKKQPKKMSVDANSSDEDVQLLKNKKQAPAKVAEKKPKKAAVSDSDDSVSPPKAKAKASPKKSPKKAPVKKPVVSDDSEDEAPKKKAPVKKAAVSDDSEDEAPKKKAPVVKAQVKAPVKATKPADSDSESEVKPKKVVKKPAKAVSSDDEESIKVVKKSPKKQAKAAAADSDEEVVKGKAEEAGHNELFVKNLNYKSTEDGLYNYFSTYGSVTKVKLLTDKATGRSKGIAFVEFGSNQECKKALDDAANLYLDDRQLTVNYSGQKDANGGAGAPNAGYGSNNTGGNRAAGRSQGDKFTVFIKNLPFKINDGVVKKFFSGCGNIIDVRIAIDQDTGKMKGFAHVDFDSQEGLDQALKKSGQQLEGRELFIDASAPKAGGSGGRGGFGGGRGGGRGGFGGGRGSFDPMQKAQKSGAIINTGGKNVTSLDSD